MYGEAHIQTYIDGIKRFRVESSNWTKEQARHWLKRIGVQDKMSITSNEFQGLARAKKGKEKTSPPTVKAPKISKKAKQQLVPWSTPQRRSNIAYS